ncbi:hypothetical protein FA95DRAFT_214184 [Auriscalpium vulgare]|uniref:Uncharacterized protein n=1 Tax=Auriscalpium vulgare TaxID=40419 RepID=A0ACB8RM06_9AGAM|nr:hypothetical protein FA95DRAFT_214184 [Auriscalpium vulgare]
MVVMGVEGGSGTNEVTVGRRMKSSWRWTGKEGASVAGGRRASAAAIEHGDSVLGELRVLCWRCGRERRRRRRRRRARCVAACSFVSLIANALTCPSRITPSLPAVTAGTRRHSRSTFDF